MNKKGFLVGVIALMALTLTNCNRQVASNSSETASKPVAKKAGIKFIENKEFDEIKANALANNKVIFVDLYTTWCGPCKYMDKEVFTDERVGAKFNKKFINYKIDGESFSGVNMGIIYEVASYPTYLFIDGNGTVLHRIEGIREVEALLDEADMALAMLR